MKLHPGMKKYESLELITTELVGLAAEANVFMGTAMQPNRFSKEAQKIGRIEEEHLADSFGQYRPLDALISLNQNDAESSVNLGRIWVIKERYGKKRYEICVNFDPVNLRITEISRETYKSRMANRSDKVSQEVQVDLVAKSFTPSDAKGSEQERHSKT